MLLDMRWVVDPAWMGGPPPALPSCLHASCTTSASPDAMPKASTLALGLARAFKQNAGGAHDQATELLEGSEGELSGERAGESGQHGNLGERAGGAV